MEEVHTSSVDCSHGGSASIRTEEVHTSSMRMFSLRVTNHVQLPAKVLTQQFCSALPVSDQNLTDSQTDRQSVRQTDRQTEM